MQDKQAYAKNIDRLREYLLRSTGLAVLELPGHLDLKSEFAQTGGTTHDNHVRKSLAETLSVALIAFDDVQRAVGLPYNYEPRFERFLKGKS